MNFCPDCGTKIEDQKEGCPNCGYKPAEHAAGTSAEQIQGGRAHPDSELKKDAVPDKFEDVLRNVSKARGNHEKYDYYENRSYDTYHYSTPEPADKGQIPDTKAGLPLSAKVLLIVMVVFLNILGAAAGMIIGAMFMHKGEAGDRSFGRKLLITGAVFLVVDIFVWRMVFMALKVFMM